MRIPQSGLNLSSPAWPLLQAIITYWGITTGAGAAAGTTLVDANCGGGIEPDYTGLSVKILSGGAAGQVRPIQVHTLLTGTLAVLNPFTDATGAAQQIAAGTRFCILSTGGGGGSPAPILSPAIGLWMFGECDPAMVASTTDLTLTNLIGFPDDIFNDEFWIQVIHNNNAVGTAPEREIRQITDYVGLTGVFTTDAFSANVEADDLVAVFHESIMGIEILGWGTLDTSSATVPADSTRVAAYAWETNDYFNGCLLMATEGAARFAPRRIVDYVTATGIFTIDPNNPLPAAPGLVDYIIIGDQTEFVPAADGANNTTPSDVTGNKTSTPIFVADNISDQMRYLKGILAGINAGLEPTRNLLETWQDVLGIDPTVWVVMNPATGAAWARGESGAFLYAETTLNANETGRLRSVQQWIHSANTPNLNLIVKKTILEFAMLIGVPANLDNTLSFFGFSNIQAATRASNDIVGFCLLADVLQTVTDSAGAESTATAFGEDLTLHNKFRLEIYENTVDWYLNEVLLDSVAVNIPTVPCYINYFIDTDGGGASVLDLGIIKCWYEMVERY